MTKDSRYLRSSTDDMKYDGDHRAYHRDHRFHNRYRREAETYYRYKPRRAETKYVHKHRRYCRNEQRVNANHGNTHAEAVVELPWDIINNIWSRLPVKSLARFRTVSKSLNNLIHDHHLWDMRRQQQQIFILDKRQSECDRSYLSGWDYLLPSIIVYDPLTKESTTIPKLVFTRPQVCSVHTYLGFDAKRSQYKVIMLCDVYNEIDTQIVALDGYVITLGETSWRKLDIPASINSRDMFACTDDSTFVFFKTECFGILCQTVNIECYPVLKILAIDICDEKLRLLEFVDTFEKTDTAKHLIEYKLFDSGKHLALLATARYTRENSVSWIWHLVDREEGIWSQHTMSDIPYFKPYVEEVNIVGAVGDDITLVQYYDDTDKESSCLDTRMHGPLLSNLRNPKFSSEAEALSYVPSFFSPKL